MLHLVILVFLHTKHKSTFLPKWIFNTAAADWGGGGTTVSDAPLQWDWSQNWKSRTDLCVPSNGCVFKLAIWKIKSAWTIRCKGGTGWGRRYNSNKMLPPPLFRFTYRTILVLMGRCPCFFSRFSFCWAIPPAPKATTSFNKQTLKLPKAKMLLRLWPSLKQGTAITAVEFCSPWGGLQGPGEHKLRGAKTGSLSLATKNCWPNTAEFPEKHNGSSSVSLFQTSWVLRRQMGIKVLHYQGSLEEHGGWAMLQ